MLAANHLTGFGVNRSPAGDVFALDLDGATEYLAKDSGTVLGIADDWTLMHWVKLDAFGGVFFDTDDGQFPGLGLSRNRIRSECLDGLNFWSVIAWDGGATIVRNWLLGGSPFTLGVWHQLVIGWSFFGSQFDIYVDGAKQSASASKSDGSGSQMTDTNRLVRVGARAEASPSNLLDGRGHSNALWNSKLADTEVTEIYAGGAGGAFELNLSLGDYKSSANLKQWHRFGLNNQAGEPFVGSLDLSVDAVDVTPADIVTDSPI